MLSVTERYKVKGSALAAKGYKIEDPDETFLFIRKWDQTREIWYRPKPLSDEEKPVIDPERTIEHNLGFVPIVWIKNLPGPGVSASDYDGACTFRAAIETSIEIDYQLSQAGRGLKYSSDPTLLIKEPAATSSDLIHGAGNALVVSEKGDAQLLEIGGTASAAVIDYVNTLREFALESIHGNRSSPDKLSAAQSGKALEMMNQGLLWLADNLRISYGEGGLLPLLRMALAAALRFPLTLQGKLIDPPDPGIPFSLAWPSWYPLTGADKVAEAQALATLTSAGILPLEVARKTALLNFHSTEASLPPAD